MPTVFHKVKGTEKEISEDRPIIFHHTLPVIQANAPFQLQPVLFKVFSSEIDSPPCDQIEGPKG